MALEIHSLAGSSPVLCRSQQRPGCLNCVSSWVPTNEDVINTGCLEGTGNDPETTPLTKKILHRQATPLAPSPSSLSSSSPLLKHCIPSLALCWLCSTRKEGPRPPLYQDSSFSLPIPLIVNSSSSTGFPSGSVSKESVCNAGDLRSVPGWGRFPGGGHGNPLQYSCQENSIDRGAWQAIVHGVAKSWT